MIDLENLNSLKDYRKAALFFLKLYKNHNLLNDEDAIGAAIDGLYRAKQTYQKNRSNIFYFTRLVVFQYISRYLKQVKMLEVMYDPIDNKNDPFDILLKDESAKLIEKEISKLTLKQQICIRMVYYLGMTKTEIAKVFGSSRQNIDSIFKSIRSKINKDVFLEK